MMASLNREEFFFFGTCATTIGLVGNPLRPSVSVPFIYSLFLAIH